jgi:hypothetical protein
MESCFAFYSSVRACLSEGKFRWTGIYLEVHHGKGMLDSVALSEELAMQLSGQVRPGSCGPFSECDFRLVPSNLLTSSNGRHDPWSLFTLETKNYFWNNVTRKWEAQRFKSAFVEDSRYMTYVMCVPAGNDTTALFIKVGYKELEQAYENSLVGYLAKKCKEFKQVAKGDRDDVFVFLMDIQDKFTDCPNPGKASEASLKNMFFCSASMDKCSLVATQKERYHVTAARSSGSMCMRKKMSFFQA